MNKARAPDLTSILKVFKGKAFVSMNPTEKGDQIIARR